MVKITKHTSGKWCYQANDMHSSQVMRSSSWFFNRKHVIFKKKTTNKISIKWTYKSFPNSNTLFATRSFILTWTLFCNQKTLISFAVSTISEFTLNRQSAWCKLDWLHMWLYCVIHITLRLKFQDRLTWYTKKYADFDTLPSRDHHYLRGDALISQPYYVRLGIFHRRVLDPGEEKLI